MGHSASHWLLIYWTAHLLHPVIMKGFLKNGCMRLFTRSLQAPFSKKPFIIITVNILPALEQYI